MSLHTIGMSILEYFPTGKSQDPNVFSNIKTTSNKVKNLITELNPTDDRKRKLDKITTTQDKTIDNTEKVQLDQKNKELVSDIILLWKTLENTDYSTTELLENCKNGNKIANDSSFIPDKARLSKSEKIYTFLKTIEKWLSCNYNIAYTHSMLLHKSLFKTMETLKIGMCDSLDPIGNILIKETEKILMVMENKFKEPTTEFDQWMDFVLDSSFQKTRVYKYSEIEKTTIYTPNEGEEGYEFRWLKPYSILLGEKDKIYVDNAILRCDGHYIYLKKKEIKGITKFQQWMEYLLKIHEIRDKKCCSIIYDFVLGCSKKLQ